MKTTRLSNVPEKACDVRETDTWDRRISDRLPPQFESVSVRTNAGESIPAKVENVSLGGIGLRLESTCGIAANDSIDVIYLYAAMPATVRHIEICDGAVVAGLEWNKPLA
jgi:hypothetical protein